MASRSNSTVSIIIGQDELHAIVYFGSSRGLARLTLGTAIWVYGVVETGVYTEISFSVDGQETGGPFVSNRTGDSGFLYNQTMFSIEGLDPGTHIVTGSLSGSASKSQVIFDWAEYTYVTRFAISTLTSTPY